MCPLADMCELRNCLKKGDLNKKGSENLLKKDSVGTTVNVCRDNKYFFEESRGFEETIPAKTTILQSKKESRILTEEDQRGSWFYSHV